MPSLRHPFVLVLFLVLVLPVHSAESTTLTTLLHDAATAETRLDPASALDLYRRASATNPNDPFILEKISRQLSDLSEDLPDPKAKKPLLAEALSFAERAAALAPNAVNLTSVAVCHGKLAVLADTREKIERSRLVRDYAERALAADSRYDYAHHVLGRWHYEVATLHPAKRFLVRLIYGGLPDASTTAAVAHLQRAVELAPDRPAHHVELAFALRADRQPDAARATFAHALTLSPRDHYDRTALTRARTALSP